MLHRAARAEFTTPPGVIEGPAQVCVDSAGRSRVRIKVEKIDSPDKNVGLEMSFNQSVG